VIGLGMGALACHTQPGEDWTFFEIDPAVVKIARNTSLFRSLSVCAPNAPIITGDGRLTLAETPGTFDLIVLDAFSSDSVPVHLLTREAMALYAAKLNSSGAIIFNISNRYMALAQTVAMSASAHGLVAREAADPVAIATDLIAPAQVALVARTSEHLGLVGSSPTWRTPVPADGEAVWTDDYSNILAPLLRKLRPR
jgi:spermidine synthase